MSSHAATHENGYTGPIKRDPWVWENTVGEWFFEDNTLYDSRAMIFQMIEAISRDGNFNLNIGLTPEGELEPGGVKMWQDFGEFTRRNAAAIYGSSAWKIIGEDASATADSPQSANVTEQIRKLANGGKLDTTVSVQSFGIGDPAPGVPKNLTMKYQLDGKAGSIVRAEGERLTLGGNGALKIIDARFGPGSSGSIPRAFPSGPIVREHAEFAMATSDVRFTRGKDGAVYAFIMSVPKPGEILRIRALGSDAGLLEKAPATVSLLGSKGGLQWKQDADALVIKYPQSAAFTFGVVFRIN